MIQNGDQWDRPRGSTGVDREKELRGMKHLLVIFLALGLGLTLQASVAAQPTKVKVKVVNGQRVYSPRNLASGSTVEKVKPALVDAKRIFDSTAQYKRIKKEGIKKNSAEYKLLEAAASTAFKNAVQRAMSQHGYDVIAETGAITVAGKSLPDATQKVIDQIQ